MLQGFQFGFRIPLPPPPTPTWAHNLPSVVGMEDVVHFKIRKELEAGHVAGPFTRSPIRHLQISPLGVVLKKALGEYRPIHHPSG